MINKDRLFEGGRRLSVVISLLWLIGCLIPFSFSAKEVWDEHQLRATEHRDFWAFAEKETDKVGPWTVFRFEDTRVWRKAVARPSKEWDELTEHFPTDSLETDLKELRQRSWQSFIDKSEEPVELAVFGFLLIYATRKACGWVIRGFIGSESK